MPRYISFEQTFAVTVKTLKIIGFPSSLNPYPEEFSTAAKLNAYFVVSFLSLSYCVLGQCVYVWKETTEKRSEGVATLMEEVATQIACTGFCVIGLQKMFVLAYHRNRLARILADFHADWKEKERIPTQRDFCQRNLRSTVTIATCAAIMNIVMVSAFNFLPIPEMIFAASRSDVWKRQLPYKIWYPWDSTKGWIYYLMYTFEVYAGLIVAIGNVTFNCIFCLVAAHLSVQLNLLAKSLEGIIAGEPSEWDVVEDKRLSLASAVERHQKLLGYKHSLETIFSFTIFIVFASASIIICFQGIMMTTSTAYIVAKFLLFFICVLLEIFFLCHYGNKILRSSEDVGIAAYKCLWYQVERGGNATFRKDLIPVIVRAQKPMVLMAWKFWPITIKTFGMVLNASYSYFTLLRTVYK
ncbi:odorant receptor 4-like [Toxorhynchites rutilus septentrionalis]|uniref:odorant receptor 4-like n=1 Tax=Toxorhynchites rutilus septentrionalis TaxID=329112 RepID=UPI0024795C98|nr:odorant receptor 4-like [Toxorhynchites rutilus septentrionalis]